MNIHNLTAYELLEERMISDVQSMSYILRHKKSGAKIAVLSNDDDNKVFYIGFRTPPEDETGVPHIIEHTTLCGSKKFPVKDPFVELVKGSLNTFLNAMTYPDKTLYPIASYNDQDFKNLMDVYMDAVFHPNITKYKEIFQQEGWHYELESEDAPLTINGVVYNEMKGAYSSPEEILDTQIGRALFPDNAYSKVSGGNPEYIPSLTYEAYLEFYKKYYHPSNSYIYLYGDMDVAERLDWLDKNYLHEYDCETIDSQIQPQTAFPKVCRMQIQYPIATDEPEEHQTWLSYSKVVGTVLDATLYQAFEVLDYALVSAPGAPVRQALIDAGIGDDVSASFDRGILQPVFTIFAKNTEKEDEDAFVSIIEQTLRKLVKEGIDKKALLAGINTMEFRFREGDYGHYPKGLLYGLQCMDSWLFDDMKPFLHLECLETFEFLKFQIGTKYYENLIQKYLLDNTHGAIVTVVPKKGLAGEQEKELEERLEAYKQSLSPEQRKELIAQTIHLKEYQEQPSSIEELQKIPMLTREDIRKEALPFQNREEYVGSIPVVHHEIATNGIDYLTLMFETGDIQPEEIGYYSILRSILGFTNTKNYSYSQLANEINICTGGIYSSTAVYPTDKEEMPCISKFEIRIRVLEDNLKKALALVQEIIETSDLTDVKRLGEIIAQTKSRLQMSLSSSGHTTAAIRSMSYQSTYAWYQEQLHGISYYASVCKMEKMVKEEPQKLIDIFTGLCKKIFAQNRLLVSATMSMDAFEKARPLLQDFAQGLSPEQPVGAKAQPVLEKKNEGFTDASQIQYVANSGNFIKKGHSYNGCLHILNMILSYDYLWINVRVKGGAYGCMTAFMRNGDAYFVSYRDPNLAETKAIFAGVPEYLEQFQVDERDMSKYVIGTFGNLDTPMYPEAKGVRSMNAYLTGLTYEQIQKDRNQILQATAQDIRNLAPLVRAVLADDHFCVIGNENKIRKEADLFMTIKGLYE